MCFMTFLKLVIRPYLFLQYYLQKLTRTGTFGENDAVFIRKPFEKSGNFVKDGLFRHHVKQFHESSCSVASVVPVVNTLLERQGVLPAPVVTQHDLLEKVNAAHWKKRMSDDGYRGRRGLPLDLLGQVVKAALDVYKIRYRSTEIVQVTEDPSRSKESRDLLRERLERFETKGDCLIIAHFDQGSFLREFHIPHISPVGGFDPMAGRVTLLDVDSILTCPYAVSFDTFYRGLAYDYNPMFRHFGYGEGGYIFIRI